MNPASIEQLMKLAGPVQEPTQQPRSINGKHTGKPNDAHTQAYAQAALDGELSKLGAAQVNERNNLLNSSAFALGQLVAGGVLAESVVESELSSVALAIGLESSEIRSTLRSGLEAGKGSPRGVPEGSSGNYSAASKREVLAESIYDGPEDVLLEEPPEDPYSDEKYSAGTTSPSAERIKEPKRDVFMTARQLTESTPEDVEWVVKPFVPLGGVTELDGQIKGGKTTLVLAMVAAVLDGGGFLGRPTKKGPVVYLTEQPQASFKEALRRAGVLERDDLYLLFFGDVMNLSWEQKVATAVEKAIEVGAVLLVVDTLGWWSGMRGDDENSTGAAQAAMEPLIAAAGKYPLGVLVLRHERKSGGDVGNSARGSSAFGGSVDVILALQRPQGNPGANPNMRVIHSLSRFDETPPQLMIELTGDGYVAHGDAHAVALTTAREAVVEALKAAKSDETNISRALTLEELEDACKAKDAKRTTLQDALHGLEHKFLTKKIGAGVRGSPYRYMWVGD